MEIIPASKITHYPRRDAELGNLLAAALGADGFFAIDGDVIDRSKIDDALDRTVQTFALPAHTKRQYHVPGIDGQRGYTGPGPDQSLHGIPDPREYWHVGREKLPAPPGLPRASFANVWPAEIPEFRTALLRLFDEVDELGVRILRILDDALGASGYFDRALQDGDSGIRCLRYPSLDSGVGEEMQMRAAAHTDIDFLTVFIRESDEGLQMNDRAGKWITTPSSPGSILIGAGEMLTRVTNGAIPSALHRVNPPMPDSPDRYSLIFCVHPRPDAELVAVGPKVATEPPLPPIKAHDFLVQRIAELRQPEVSDD